MLGNRYAIEWIKLIDSKNLPPHQLLANTGLEWAKVQSGEQIVRKAHFRKTLRTALEQINEPDLGLQFGRRLNANTHGILGFALMNCSTLNELVQVWLRYHSINHAELELSYRVDDSVARLISSLNGDAAEARFHKEVLFASVHTTAGFLLNESRPWADLHFDYPAPAYADRYRELFGNMPLFNQAVCQLRVPVGLLDKPLPRANAEASAMYQNRCAEMLATMTRRDGLAKKVQRLLLEQSGEFPRIAELAESLHISERTLRRKLTAEGTSFQEVFNDVRYRMAREYLEATQLSVADIADLLGFADPSNFRRAFIQWSNQSPAHYRKIRRDTDLAISA